MDNFCIEHPNPPEVVDDTVLDSVVERGEVQDFDDLAVGQMDFFAPYPGETEYSAVFRLRQSAAQYFRRTGRAISFEAGGGWIVMRRLQDGPLNRLRAWTGLNVGQIMIYKPNGAWMGMREGIKAERIACMLEKWGLGTFQLFLLEDENHIFVRRLA